MTSNGSIDTSAASKLPAVYRHAHLPQPDPGHRRRELPGGELGEGPF